MNGSAPPSPKAIESNVILISDESAPASPVIAVSGPSVRLPHSPVNIIDISDTSTSISVNQNVISILSSPTHTNPNSPAGEVGAAPLASLSNADPSDDEEIVPMLNLARFAFANPNPRPLQSQSSASTVDSASGSDTQAKPAAKKTARSSSKGVAEDFSDAELRKLIKCVSCDLSWTARKTAAQKMLHIRSCAKKTGLTDQTIRALIRKEVDNAPEPGQSKVALVPAQRTTLYEDIVREAGPKRKGKRKPAVDILKNVTETRENIRGNARMILGPESLSDGDDFIVQTQAVTSDKPATTQEHSATQVFGPSRLGQQHGYKSSILGDPDPDDDPDIPPATQAFAPSKLGGRAAARGWGYESESEGEGPGSEPDAPIAENPLALPSSSAKEGYPRSSPRTTKNMIAAAPTFPAMENNFDDNAYVQFDSELELNREAFVEINHNTVTSPKPKKSKKSTTRETPTETKTTKGRIQVPSDAKDSPRPPSPKAKPKRSGKKTEDELDDRWELGIKEKILADHDLHLRILRYEPINFDIFLKLATEDEATARLRLKLRLFLDKQAINFYGGEATSRTRKRRR
ncbi:hypothetical protein MVEN_01231900 [Mycena venus]|uniref:Uncharacterized protein n=1 Tax=Mycena venus TaxID=2733690 RepID=A0A8H7CYJ9_9AGAR|nr:hypothetical protein MVEN_01231900 [Mycena venus]